jgi:phage replication O-like protein O
MSKRDKEFYARQNKILDKLAKSNLSGTDLKYCLVLYRKTFGFGKYEDRISRSQFALKTGVLEVHVSRTEKRLKDKNIIFANSKTKGFNLNTDQWEKVPGMVPFQKVPELVPEGTNQADKKGTSIGTYKETTKKLPTKKEKFYTKLSGKEIDLLELDPWYKAIMWNIGKFSIEYIEGTIKEHSYATRMTCWYQFVEAKNIREKEPYFSRLLWNETEK